MQSLPNKCQQCDRIFASHSLRYYCCNSDYQCCILCNQKKCNKCGKERKSKYESIRCQICREYCHQSFCFYEFKSDQSFCCLCMKKATKNSLSDTILLKQGYLTTSICDRQQAQLFLKSFCWKCSKKLTIQQIKQHQAISDLTNIKCQKCKYLKQQQQHIIKQQNKQVPKRSIRQSEGNRFSGLDNFIFQSKSTRCTSCGYLIYGNKGFITQDFSICESCAKFSCYEQDKIIRDNANFMQSENIQKNNDDWSRKDDDYWKKNINKEEDIMVENINKEEDIMTENQKKQIQNYEYDEIYNKQYEYGNEQEILDNQQQIKDKLEINQPMIIQDFQYRSQVYSERKLKEDEEVKENELVIVIKEDKIKLQNKTQIKQEKIEQQSKIKKSSSFKLLQNEKLQLKKQEEQLVICGLCCYQVQIKFLIQKMCKCCYIEFYDQKKKRQEEQSAKKRYLYTYKKESQYPFQQRYNSYLKQNQSQSKKKLSNLSDSPYRSQLVQRNQQNSNSRKFEPDIRRNFKSRYCPKCYKQTILDGDICISCKSKKQRIYW